jgi:hypothetical protein
MVAEFNIVIADTPLILLSTRDHSLTADTEAVKLVKYVGFAVEDAEAWRRIVWERVEILIEIIVDDPRTFVCPERSAQ